MTNKPQDGPLDPEFALAESHALASSLGEVIIGKDPAIALGAIGLLTIGTIKTCWTKDHGVAIGAAYLDRLKKELI